MLKPALSTLLVASLISTSTSFVIYPEAFLTNPLEAPAPAISHSYDTTPTTHPKDTDTAAFHKCLDTDSHPRSPLISITRIPPSTVADDEDDSDPPLPVLLWHGLGDSANSDGIKGVASLLDEVNPGTYTFLISLGDASADKQASFFGNLTGQLETVCESILKDNILKTAPGVDMLGFSQGGQFLRGLVETCDGLPKTRSLITFGSQHNGISKFQRCKDGGDWVCRAAEALVSSGGVWAGFVQDRIVPAQYFRDPMDLDAYLKGSKWLADVNNERKLKNELYKERLGKVDKFVMIQFEDDETVVPKVSSWFGEIDAEKDEVIDLRNRTIYKEDWIGLKKLDKKGGLIFETVKGGHMQLHEKDLKRFFTTYYGPMEDESEKEESSWWVTGEDWSVEL